MPNEEPAAGRACQPVDGDLFKAIVVTYEVIGPALSKVRQYDPFALTEARRVDEIHAFGQPALAPCLFDVASRKRGQWRRERKHDRNLRRSRDR